MSVRVNLIPREVEQRNVARRQQAMWGLAGLALVVLLVVLYFVQVGRVNAARDELAAEEAVRNELRAEVEELAAFADLQARADALNAMIAAVLANEASMAGILQDVAAVTPSDVAISTLVVTINIPDEAGETVPTTVEARRLLGSVTMTGQALDSHAPGLERFLISLEKIASFDNVLFTTSTLVEDLGDIGDRVVEFSVSIDLGPEILTGQYVNGVPEGLR